MFKGTNQFTKPEDKATDESRFLAKINKTETCWIWNSSKTPAGYGLYWVGGKAINGGKFLLAHRYSYEYHNDKKIGEGMILLHSCDNPSCVNPAHLTEGTHKENMDDMKAKKREKYYHIGETNGACKLTAEKVLEIREKYAKGGVSQRQLGEEYELCQQHICQIINRKRWSHI